MSNKIAPISGKKSVGVSMTQLHQGPIPSAEEMRQYSQVFPDLPQRIVKMAEDEQKHRFAMEESLKNYRDSELRSNTILAYLGIFSSVLCVLIIMSASVLCAYFQHPITAGIIGSGGVVMIVSVLVCGSRVKPNGSSQSK